MSSHVEPRNGATAQDPLHIADGHVYSRKRVEKGKNIVCESPTIFVPDVFALLYPSANMKKIFDSAPLNEALASAGCTRLICFTTCHLLLRAKEDEKARTLLQSMKMTPAYRSEQSHEPYVATIAAIADCSSNEVRVALAKVATNVFAVTATILGCCIGHALYEYAAFIKHSCRPNTYTYFKTDGSIVLVALRDIEAGEELTYCFLRGIECKTFGNAPRIDFIAVRL